MKHIISLFEDFKEATAQMEPTPVQHIGKISTVLVGGLDYRSGDLKIDQQVKLLNDGIGGNIAEIKGFRYNESTQVVLDFLKNNPGAQVFLFSAGCAKTEAIAKSGFVDKKRIYVIEPYGVSANTKATIQRAVNLGLPPSNVFVGSSQARGFGIVNGASNSNAKGHWTALTSVAMLRKGS